MVLTMMKLHTLTRRLFNPLPSSDGFDFIRTACNPTLYPDLCFSTLFSFGNSIHDDSNRLTRIAISLPLYNTLHLLSYLQNAYNRDNQTAVLKGCFKNLEDAVVSAPPGSVQSFRLQMSNVKTWLSAALTYEYTCTDGFEDFHEDDSIKMTYAHEWMASRSSLAMLSL